MRKEICAFILNGGLHESQVAFCLQRESSFLRWKYYWQLGNTYALCCNFCHSSVGHVICDIHSSETEKYSSQTIGRRFFRPLLWVLMSGYNSIGWETVTLSGGNLIFWAILICCLATRGPKMGRSFWNVDKMLFWYMTLLFTKYEVNRPNGLGVVRGQTDIQTYRQTYRGATAIIV